METPPKHANSSGGARASSCGGGRVAFFGWSFDPPHQGHIAVARAARDALHLDSVLFAPVGAQPLKPRGSTAPFADRVAMTELAIAGEPGFEISLADAPNAAGQPNYTLDSLRCLRAGLPSDGCLFCLMGADSFASLSRWHGSAEIPFTAALIVASRPGQRLDDLARYLPSSLTLEPSKAAVISGEVDCVEVRSMQSKDLCISALRPQTADKPGIELSAFLVRNPAGKTAPVYVLPGLHIEISASDIRAQVRSSSQDAVAANSLLPAPVADYIRTRALYR